MLQVELALDAVQHVGADRALAVQPQDGVPLYLDELERRGMLGPPPPVVGVVQPMSR